MGSSCPASALGRCLPLVEVVEAVSLLRSSQEHRHLLARQEGNCVPSVSAPLSWTITSLVSTSMDRAMNGTVGESAKLLHNMQRTMKVKWLCSRASTRATSTGLMDPAAERSGENIIFFGK